jgi:hypothetical protein
VSPPPKACVNSSCVCCALIALVEVACVPSTCLQNLVCQGRGQRQQQQQQQAQQPGQQAGDAHDWVRQTVLEEQPFHAASSPSFARARCNSSSVAHLGGSAPILGQHIA